ncbi:unnamed protein product [Allacma fusca]|uniref:Uncharacterized protein n=1 Tax=Allacma fusca TaxID=39272 RepID=A0A8J2P1K3_9HEXA|nr:unnamed protein product [Allacma fusca]
MDIATRLNRSFIGINVQFYKEGRFRLYTLAVKELHKSHTAETILEYLENTIKEYGIHREQVYSATVDNGSNFLCALRVCSEISDEVEDGSDEETEPPDADTDDVVVIQEQDEFDKFTIPWLKTMRCAAHTLQLAVWDFIKARNIQAIIVKARWLVRKLRTPTLRYMLKARELPAPLIDVVTRWSSTAVMLEHLVKLENTVKELVEKRLIESKGIHTTFWNSLKELSSLLEPATIATT